MIVSDLHLHSKYSRATSKQLDITNLEKWGKVKGLNLLGTGDFCHPEWNKELKNNLTGEGILKSENGMDFVLSNEISLIYTQDGKGRRVHVVILAPSFDVVDQITEYLLTKGRIDYDGRPIFKIPAFELVESLRSISKDIEVIPAHIWTPWFGLLGSKSGFDSVEEGFKDQAKYVHALETGLSSDPEMNWRLSCLDKYNLVSFSDSHSFWPWRIGREATIFDMDLSYRNLLNALRTGEGLKSTIEVDPGYGKYHYDGHRNCGVSLSPEETKKVNGICPKCGGSLTIGVESRVEELADRELGFRPAGAKDFKKLIPLSEILCGLLNCGIATRKVWEIFNKLIKEFGNDLNVLLNASQEDLNKIVGEKIAEVIIKNREGKIKIKPGYDGEYGVPLFINKKQANLTEF